MAAGLVVLTGCSHHLESGLYASAIGRDDFQDSHGKIVVSARGFDYFDLARGENSKCLRGTDYTVTRFPRNTASSKDGAMICPDHDGHVRVTLYRSDQTVTMNGRLTADGFTLHYIDGDKSISETTYRWTTPAQINENIASLRK